MELINDNINEENYPVVSLVYEGEQKEIEAKTYLESLNAISDILIEINVGERYDKNIKLMIRANRPGCFICDLGFSQIITALPILLQQENIKIAFELIKYFSEILKLRKFLKNDSPKNIEQLGDGSIALMDSNGATININQISYNYYFNNENIPKLINQNFSALENDKTIEEFCIIKNNEKVFSVKRDDFKELIIEEKANTESDKIETFKQVNLTIIKASFERDLTWNFLYLGNRIGAKIIDIEFLTKVENREENFSAGDVFLADIEINQKFDNKYSTYINKEIRIIKIYDHIKAPKQLKMFNTTKE
jgi:hypothetical protein